MANTDDFSWRCFKFFGLLFLVYCICVSKETVDVKLIANGLVEVRHNSMWGLESDTYQVRYQRSEDSKKLFCWALVSGKQTIRELDLEYEDHPFPWSRDRTRDDYERGW